MSCGMGWYGKVLKQHPTTHTRAWPCTHAHKDVSYSVLECHRLTNTECTPR